MNIWIDILHIPQLNYFKPFITQLSEKGHRVYVTVLGRGKLPVIAQKELQRPNVTVNVIGKHRMNKWSVLLEANLLRLMALPFFLMGKHIDMAFSSGSHVGIMGRLFGFRAYGFVDDPQTTNYKLLCQYDTQNHSLIYELPEGQHLDPRDKMLPVLKEWAYLNPRTFVPNEKVLKAYGVKPKEYLFLREVSVGTINYTGQESGAILGIKDMLPKGMKVLFSLEEKKRRNEYPADWILLQEPIEDIHSLIYYSAGLVSSGDSMAREAALLGVPAYYLGIRYSMPANAAASKVASLQNRQTMPFEQWIARVNELMNEGMKELTNQQNSLRQHIDHEFIDINQYMMELVESLTH